MDMGMYGSSLYVDSVAICWERKVNNSSQAQIYPARLSHTTIPSNLPHLMHTVSHCFSLYIIYFTDPK